MRQLLPLRWHFDFFTVEWPKGAFPRGFTRSWPCRREASGQQKFKNHKSIMFFHAFGGDTTSWAVSTYFGGAATFSSSSPHTTFATGLFFFFPICLK